MEQFIRKLKSLWWALLIFAAVGAWALKAYHLPAHVDNNKDKINKNEIKILENKKDIEKNREAIEKIVPALDQIGKDVSYIRGRMEK
jgi:hypothetical protein